MFGLDWHPFGSGLLASKRMKKAFFLAFIKSWVGWTADLVGVPVSWDRDHGKRQDGMLGRSQWGFCIQNWIIC